MSHSLEEVVSGLELRSVPHPHPCHSFCMMFLVDWKRNGLCWSPESNSQAPTGRLCRQPVMNPLVPSWVSLLSLTGKRQHW